MNIPLASPPSPPRLAVLALGFRPFYLLAGAFGALSIVLWTAHLSGFISAAQLLESPYWHAHEMLFGYAFAVITGFLFTAVRNWTQLSTPAGGPLALLAVIWLAGRVLALSDWREWAALTDTLFALGVAAGIGLPLIRSRNARNYFFIALVLALGAANLAFNAARRGSIYSRAGADRRPGPRSVHNRSRSGPSRAHVYQQRSPWRQRAPDRRR